jgi:ABC transport system ATP-binding/permease protein
VELQRFAVARLGKDVVDVENATVRLGDRQIFHDVTWRLGPGDRVGVLGPNGAGKSTLLRVIAGELAPASGRVRVGRTVVPAMLTQDVAEVEPTLRVLQAVEEVAGRVELGKGREATAGQLLERLGFAAERQWTPVADLSGGERRRLQLLRLLMRGPNLLLLDEPTNDLDVDTLAEVEDVLDGWAGTLVVVSHERWFLERVCDSLWAVAGDGTVRHLPGGVDDYLAMRARVASAASAPTEARPKGDTRAARKELVRIERRLERITREEASLHAAIADNATDYERVADLDRQLRALAAERDELEESWLMLAEDAS